MTHLLVILLKFISLSFEFTKLFETKFKNSDIYQKEPTIYCGCSSMNVKKSNFHKSLPSMR